MLDVNDAILDGEVIAADATGRPQFYGLLRHARAPAYVAFDMLWADWCRPARFAAQRAPAAAARHCAKRISDPLSEALSVEGRGRQFFDLVQAHDLEGIVAKRLQDPYEPRVRWLKIKNRDYTQKEGRSELFNEPRSAR